MRKGVLFLMSVFACTVLLAQSTVSSYPTFNANNGSGGISFEVEANADVQILEFENTLYSGSMSVQVWYRMGGVGAGSPNVTSGGWILHETVSCVGNGSTPTPVPLTTPLVLQGGVRYGFALGNSSTTVRYMNTVASPTSFTDGLLTLYTNAPGYGGTLPNLTISGRSFVGSVTYELLSTAINDAGVFSLDTPGVVCEGPSNVVATIKNYGINQISSVQVNWSINGALQTPVAYNQVLDTFGGTGLNTAQILLGSHTFTNNVLDEIAIWTSDPNNMADTVSKNDTLIAEIMPAMAGVYTIDPAGFGPKNYLTFAAAIADLNNFGVCSTTVFNIAAGTYPEQIAFDEVVGASETNTITFRPDPNNTSPVELSFAGSSSNNYVVLFGGADWITFEDITITSSGTYCTAVRMESGASNNTIDGCILNGPTLSSTSTNSIIFYSNDVMNESNNILNNTIRGGSYGIYYRGSGTTSLVPGVNIQGNTVVDPYYYGIYLYYTDAPQINYNKVTSNSGYTSGYAISSYYGDNGAEFIGNQVYSMGGVWPLYGLRVYYSDGTDSLHNTIANNMVHVGNPTLSSTTYGLTVYSNNYSDVVYNTVVQEGTGTSSRAGYIYTGANNTAYNNNFLHYGNGYSVYTSTGAFIWDYNNIASAGSNLAYNSSTVPDFAGWQAAGYGANSISVNNIFPNPDSLRTCNTAIYRKGAVVGVTYDIDGDPRQPDTTNIGADAFIADASDFTIGDTIEFCGGTELEIGGTMDGGSFFWSTGQSTPTIIVTEEGNYTVTVDGPCVSGMVDDVEVVDVNPVASFNILEGQFIGGFENTSEYGVTYFWDFGDGTTSTESDPWHQYADNGPYTVSLTVMNECDTVTIEKEVQFSVGLNEITFGSRVKVYPNPASSIINIAFGDIDDQTVQVELFDTRGQQISHTAVKATQNGTETMDISSLSKGVYMIKLTTNNEVATKQIIVQ